MKVKILSDDHIEMRAKNWERYMDEVHPPYDGTLLHAGDLIPAIHPQAENVFRSLCRRYHRVFYVPGNHDYYTSRIEGGWDVDAVDGFLLDMMKEIPNLRIGITGAAYRWRERDADMRSPYNRLYAGTMWFPDTPALRRSWNLINDPAQIKHFAREIDASGLDLPQDRHSVNFIEDELRDGATLPWFAWSHAMFRFGMHHCTRPGDIVMSHHLPSDQSSPPMWRREVTQPFFVAAGMEDMIKKYQPSVWIHGHTHSACDYRLGDPVTPGTRVICNPVGYPSEGVKRLEPAEGLLRDEFEI